MGYDGKNCMPTLVEGPGGVPGDGPGSDSWGYQSCTETLHQFSSVGAIRNYSFSFKGQSNYCQKIFNHTVSPNPNALTDRFGGYKLGDGKLNVSQLIWSNGGLDPWHGGGFLKPGSPNTGNHWIFMERGAHHLDLRAPHPEDPPEVTAAREKEEAIILSWIEAASLKVKCDVDDDCRQAGDNTGYCKSNGWCRCDSNRGFSGQLCQSRLP